MVWLLLLLSSLSVSPRITLAPSDIHVIARIPRDSENRAFCVTAALGDFIVRRSCQDLDADSPVTYDFYWRDLREPGDYVVDLGVVTADGHVTHTTTSLTLKGGDDDPR